MFRFATRFVNARTVSAVAGVSTFAALTPTVHAANDDLASKKLQMHYAQAIREMCSDELEECADEDEWSLPCQKFMLCASRSFSKPDFVAKALATEISFDVEAGDDEDDDDE